MADSNAPRMPPAASSNIGMSMSIMPKPIPKPNDMLTDPISKQDTAETAEEKSHPAPLARSQRSATTSSVRVTASNLLAEDARRDRTRTREKESNLQCIQLAEKLGNERKISADLEARITSLRDELARLTFTNEAYEAECARLHRQIDEAAQQLETQTTLADQRKEDMVRRIADLESKLNEATNSLEESILNCDLLQSSHAEAVKTCDQQSDKIKKLDHDLGISHAIAQDLTSKYDKLQELYNNDVKQKISILEESQEQRERHLQQRLTLKGREVHELRQKINSIQAAFENADKEKEDAQKALVAQAERYKSQALEEQQRFDDVVNSWDESLAESEKLRRSLQELEKSTKPFSQTIVICVDVSGSLSGIIHEVKQAYRDILHMIKSINSNAGVSVVVHGDGVQHEPLPIQEISEATFQMIDSFPLASNTENYTYCLKRAHEILETEVDSKNLVILIGDGNAVCSHTPPLIEACEQLKCAKILVHSIIISGTLVFTGFTMRKISETIGGRVEYKDTYMSAFEEILRGEREQYFKE